MFFSSSSSSFPRVLAIKQFLHCRFLPDLFQIQGATCLTLNLKGEVIFYKTNFQGTLNENPHECIHSAIGPNTVQLQALCFFLHLKYNMCISAKIVWPWTWLFQRYSYRRLYVTCGMRYEALMHTILSAAETIVNDICCFGISRRFCFLKIDM